MQLVDFRAAFGMLNFPHPLLGDDVDFQSVARRIKSNEIQAGAPDKHYESQTEWHDRPENFQSQIADNWLGLLIVGSTPVFDGKGNDQDENQSGEKYAYAEEKIIKLVDPRRHRRSLLGKQRKAQRRHDLTPSSWSPSSGSARAAAARSRSQLGARP